MRTEAVVLLWMGRPDIILLIMLLVHVMVIWRLRRDGVAPKLAAAWFVLSIVLLVTVFYNSTFQRAGNGSGYVAYHFPRWSDEEALSTMLSRWRNLWLPAYVPWLGTWLAGLLAIVLLPKQSQVIFTVGLRRLTSSISNADPSKPAVWGVVSVMAAVVVAAAFAFWQFTAMPIAETSPLDGAANVPTNAPITVRLTRGDRNWGPGIRVIYAETGEIIQGSGGGWFQREIRFSPQSGWHPNARVEVQVCCGPLTRSYRFSFTTGDGPSPDVAAIPGASSGAPPPRPSPR